MPWLPLGVASEARPEDGTAQLYLAEAFTRLGDFPMAAEALGSARARSGETEQFLVAWARFSLNRFSDIGKLLTRHQGRRGNGTPIRSRGPPGGE